MARTARTAVILEKQEMTLLMGGALADLIYCPFCGQKLAAARAEPAKPRLQRDSTGHAPFPSIAILHEFAAQIGKSCKEIVAGKKRIFFRNR